jgi:uncharacterized protein (TIGR00255 family)
MTGFARAEGGIADRAWVFEARSVNGRGLDIKYRYPPGFEAVERLGRELAKTRLARGQVNVTLALASGAAVAGVKINADVLRVYLDAAQSLVEAGDAVTPEASGLLALKGVIEAGDDRAELSPEEEEALSVDFQLVLDRLCEARRLEGAALEAILLGHLDTMALGVERARALAAQQVEVIRERFVRRVEELASDTDFQERVLQEAALLAAKADVREELDRLASHIGQARTLIKDEPAPGRKLDFLAQEFMREANTLCSKSAFIELTQAGLELKAVIDQFREQTQNVE